MSCANERRNEWRQEEEEEEEEEEAMVKRFEWAKKMRPQLKSAQVPQ